MDYNVIFFYLDSGVQLSGLTTNQKIWQSNMVPLKKRMVDRLKKRKQINDFKGLDNKEQFDEVLFWDALTQYFDEGFTNCVFNHANSEFEVYKYARFDDYYKPLGTKNTKLEWERFKKIEKKINDIISVLRAKGLSLTSDNFYNEIPTLLSEEVFNKEELKLFAMLYCFATDNSRQFTIQKKNNRNHTKVILKDQSYLDLWNLLNGPKYNDYTTNERFYMNKFISTFPSTYKEAKIKELFKYAYNIDFFSQLDFLTMQTFCPSLNPSDFDAVIKTMIELQKKSTS